jgi:hypothetical protein
MSVSAFKTNYWQAPVIREAAREMDAVLHRLLLLHSLLVFCWSVSVVLSLILLIVSQSKVVLQWLRKVGYLTIPLGTSICFCSCVVCANATTLCIICCV